MNRILIKNVEKDSILTDILIEGNIIKKISPNITISVQEVIEADGYAVIPGFVNMHTHAAMTIMRGIGEDMFLHDWITNKIWPTEKRLTEELIYWGTKLAALEMIKSGTTCYNDQYWMIPSAVKAVEEMGIRSVQSYVFLDLNDKTKWERLKNECSDIYIKSKTWSDLTLFSVSVHSIYSVSKEMILWASDFARKNNLMLHIHLSETERENIECINIHGVSPTKYLENLGILGPNVIAAHSLWLSDDDIITLAKYDVKIVHNINSNLKIASGYKFRYNELKNSGLTVCLGTDGCASSNNLDMIETMKTAALVQKAWRHDPTAMPLNELTEMATYNGAKSLGLKAGKIEEGWLADLALINLDTVAFTPNINFKANLVYSANGSCIDTVICNGNIVMRNKVVKGEQEILRNVNSLYKQLV